MLDFWRRSRKKNARDFGGKLCRKVSKETVVLHRWWGNKVIWSYKPSWKCKLATVTSWKADVSSVSPSCQELSINQILIFKCSRKKILNCWNIREMFFLLVVQIHPHSYRQLSSPIVSNKWSKFILRDKTKTRRVPLLQ